MSADRVRILREGYLDVKAPPDSPERILHKAWRRLWVVVASYIPSSRSSDPQLILQLHRRPRPPEGPPEGTPPPVKRVRCPREGLRLFRCRSSSRPLRTFGVASGSDLVLYFAAETEDRSQQWMDDLREGLWPSFAPPPTGVWWDVSLLDDDDSAGCGLLGAYGRLGLTAEDALCLLHPHWQATQVRWGTQDLLSVAPVRTTVDAEGVFKVTVKCNKKGGRVFQFYSKRVSETVDWIKSVIDPNFKPKHSTEETKQDHLTVKEAQGSDYGKLNTQVNVLINDTKQAENTNEGPTADQATKNGPSKPPVPPKEAHKTHRRLPSLPGHLLDSSTCSFLRGGNSSGPASAEVSDEEEEDDSYDHIYEEMRVERSGTVYEEIDDLTPITVAVPPPPDEGTLRLQKLSESLSEALKTAEQVKEDPKLVRRKSSKKAERPKKALSEMLAKELELPLRPLLKRSPSRKKEVSSTDLKQSGDEACSKVPVKEETEAKHTDLR